MLIVRVNLMIPKSRNRLEVNDLESFMRVKSCISSGQNLDFDV
jgi:hypothetical protein